MDQLEFEKFYKKQRSLLLSKPYDLAYKSFVELSLDTKDEKYFIKNASRIIEMMRNRSWINFQIDELEFSKRMFSHLIDPDVIKGLHPQEAIKKYIDLNTEKFYSLALSNTQSRRSRAGTEFEAVIELLLMGAKIKLDSQGSLSSGIFEKHDLGKAVDIVSPGVIEYSKHKRKVKLISCKTTLRERWSEVIEEKERTGASEVYLCTLDDKISDKTINQLNVKNVILVVTKELKLNNYHANSSVITYEELLEELVYTESFWTKEKYSEDELKVRLTFLNEQIVYHRKKGHTFVEKYYSQIIEMKYI